VNGHVADGWMFINLASGKRVTARATICATGVEYRRLGIPGEERFLNHGVYYGAGSSEAGLCTGQVFVIGGGNSAGQAALSFSRHADTVTMLVRGASLAATLSAYLLESIQKSSNIEVRTGVRLVELKGGDRLESIIYETNEDHTQTERATRWVFLCIGGAPRTDWAEPGTLLTDESGYILTGQDLSSADLPAQYWTGNRRPLYMESSIPGMFAAGDVRHNSVKRCATAVGDGATAVSMVHDYLSSLRTDATANH
jgi:thioredoxin reductase (NADPH)